MQHGATLRHRFLPYLAIFLLSALGLAFEIAQIRVFSYTMDPHIVFGAIAMAMLGLGAAGVLVAVKPSLLEEGAEQLIPSCAVGFAASSVLALALFARLSPLVRTTSLLGILLTAIPLLLLCAIPYAFIGLATTALLSVHTKQAYKLYLFNLLGSSLGCFILYPFLRPVGIEPLLGGIGLLGALTGALFAWTLQQRRTLIISIATIAFCIGVLARPSSFFPFSSDPQDLYATSERTMARMGIPPLPGTAPGKRAKLLFSQWDPVSRVEVFEYPPPLDRMNGEAPLRLLLHDGGAGSLLFGIKNYPDLARALFEGTTYGGAYALQPSPEEILVIGLGGGPDIMTAHHYGVKHITGIEVNGSTIQATQRAFAEFLGDPYGKPNVQIFHMDGRSFVEGTKSKYDLIQLSGTDTYSAAGGGAFLFSESYLYTIEALQRYMSTLKPQGVLAMIRFGPEPLRLVVSEVQAMRSLGINDARPHLAILRQGTCEIVLFSRSPITEEQRIHVQQWIRNAQKFPAITAPLNGAMGFGVEKMPPLEIAYLQGVREEPIYKSILAAGAIGQERQAIESLDFDYTPVTDDRPFFFQFLKPSQLGRVLSAAPSDFFARGLRGHLWMLLMLCGASALVLLGPLWWKGGSLRLQEAKRPLTYFTIIGTAYLLVELALMQQTALFLGHPTYSISVTLSALLAWSGIGSLLSGRSSLTPPALLPRVAIGIGLLALLYLLGLRPLLSLLLPLPLFARGAILFFLLSPLGMLMGVPFPAGLHAFGDRGASILAWSQAANALSSVIASLFAAPLAMLIGFRAEWLLAVVLYGMAAWFIFDLNNSTDKPQSLGESKQDLRT